MSKQKPKPLPDLFPEPGSLERESHKGMAMVRRVDELLAEGAKVDRLRVHNLCDYEIEFRRPTPTAPP